MIEMSHIKVDAVNVHPGQWIANSVALGLLLWGLIWWRMS
jgi:hypothetical protein